MSLTATREERAPQLLIDLALGRLDDDEIEAMIPLLHADGVAAPAPLVDRATSIPARRWRLPRSA